MAEENLPNGFLKLSEIESGKNILKSLIKKFLIPITFIVIGLVTYFSFPILSIMFILPFSSILFLVYLIEYYKKKFIISTIAINLGHPWVEEEHEVDVADVAFKTLEGWSILPHKGRVKDNLELNELLIEVGSSESIFKIPEVNYFVDIVSNKKNIKSEIIKWLNLALALRDAQNAVEDDIEKARDREDGEELDVQRIWPETNPGDLRVKPGAIFRNFSKSKK